MARTIMDHPDPGTAPEDIGADPLRPFSYNNGSPIRAGRFCIFVFLTLRVELGTISDMRTTATFGVVL